MVIIDYKINVHVDIRSRNKRLLGFTEQKNAFIKSEKLVKSSNSLSFGSCITRFSRVVLTASRVGYHAGKPIEIVVYCLTL